MQPSIKQVAINLSEAFPIKWDRYTESNGYYNIYGWIARADGQRDFVLLQLLWFDGVTITGGVITSSAKYSKQIGQFIFGDMPHNDCIKFEADTIPTFDEGVEDENSLTEGDD